MYKDLSLKEKAKVIKEGVRLGLNSIDDIQSLYDEAVFYQQEDPIISPYGQWKYPGRDTIIPSNDITMDSVNYPVLGISDTGDAKVMMPWNDYKFRGSMVYEHPLVSHSAQDGKQLSKRKNEFVNRIESMQDKPDFMKRFYETPFLTIPDWVNANDVASHKMSWATDDKGNAIIYPNVQRVDGRLVDFTRPPYSFWAGYDSALRRGDTLMTTPGIADWWTRNYKEYYPEIREFNNNLYQLGGLTKPFSYNPIPPVRYQKGGNLSSYMNDSQLENARGIWNYLVGQKGLTQRNAAAMMGNVMQESGLNPNAKNPKSSAKGYFQMLDSKRKDYDKWLRNNPHSKDYGEFDYYVHLIDDVVDPYMDGYNSFMKRWDGVKKAYEAKPSDRNRQSMQEYQDYYDRMYRQRVENNRLFPVIDFNRAWNNYELPLNEITPLFEETFERAGEGSEHEKRNNYAQDFYDYFYDPNINRQEIFNWENNRHMQKRISPVPADFRLPNRPLAQSAQLPTDIYLNEMMLGMPSYNQLMYHEKPQGYFFSNGGIHIKPENRGKFTRLKKRTGHSASWFKAHGTPAQRKMATFALNARHWKHDDGGHLFQENGYLHEAPKTFVAKQYDINQPLDWNAESWLGERADNYKGPKYTDEDIKIFESHVPEYRQIEENARNNGTWLKMSDGTIWNGDPRDWVLMQSKAFKNNYEDKVWYTGQAEWPTTVNYNGQDIQTDEVKRARYHNGQMWFSDNPGYAQVFADYIDQRGLNSREWQYSPNSGYEKAPYISGIVFTAAIPKNSEIHSLQAPKAGTHDQWQRMPYILTETGIERIPEYKLYQNKKGRNLINDDVLSNKLITDDLVNHAENLGWKGLYMFNVDDGPVFINKIGENYIPQESLRLKGVGTSKGTINEFISLPGLTEKLKFIHGNNGDFNPDVEDKYSYLTKDNYENLIKFGGKIKKKKA